MPDSCSIITYKEEIQIWSRSYARSFCSPLDITSKLILRKTKSELLIISWIICLSDMSGLMNMFKTIMCWSCLTKIFPDVPTVPAPPTSDDAGTCKSGPFSQRPAFIISCHCWFMSLAIWGAGGNTSAFFLVAHTTRLLFILVSQPAETKHTQSIHLTLTVPSTRGCPCSNPSI